MDRYRQIYYAEHCLTQLQSQTEWNTFTGLVTAAAEGTDIILIYKVHLDDRLKVKLLMSFLGEVDKLTVMVLINGVAAAVVDSIVRVVR